MSKKYNDKYYARYGDPRTSEWLLMGNQVYPFIFGAAYFAVTKWILPRLMRNKNPYGLKTLTIGYNFGMMLLNGWVFYELGSLTWFKPNFKWLCQSIDWSNAEDALRVAEVGWIFLITTILECLTTVLIVLRRKDSHSSVLHIFLRMQAPIVVWYGLKFAPGGYNSLYSLLTLFINTVAHFHYGVLAVIPSLRRVSPWERFTLPALYLTEFTLVFIYYSQLYFFPPKGCKLSFFILRLNMGSAILFFVFAKDFFLSKKNKGSRRGSSKSEKAQKIE